MALSRVSTSTNSGDPLEGPSSQLNLLLDYLEQKTCVKARTLDDVPGAVESAVKKVFGMDVKVLN